MDAHQTTKETVSRAIDEIKSIDGVIACALVTKTGIMMGKYFEDGSESARLVGVLCASILSSAEAVTSILQIGLPSDVTVNSDTERVILMGAGDKVLLITVLKRSQDEQMKIGQLREISERIGSEW